MNSMISAMRSAARKRKDYRNMVHDLNGLTDRQLSDIGVCGRDTEDFAHRAVYGA